jgi:regulatory protein
MGPPKKVSESHLENVALYYLQRFAASAETLRRVLRRRVERSARVHCTDRGEGNAMADAAVARMVAAGLVDDRAFAAARAARLHARGAAPRLIAAHLRGKGIAPELIEETLAGLGGGKSDGGWRAAVNLARRRRLGPFRAQEERAAAREKDLAAFARAGFAYAIARRILTAATPEELGEDGEG